MKIPSDSEWEQMTDSQRLRFSYERIARLSEIIGRIWGVVVGAIITSAIWVAVSVLRGP